MPKFEDMLDHAITLAEHDINDVDCELKLDFRVLIPNQAKGKRGHVKFKLCSIKAVFLLKTIQNVFKFSESVQKVMCVSSVSSVQAGFPFS